tara:strand:+ start:824 stop:1708 length:885 start_codon:yes stop_codon:yes gene_type:complete
MLQLGGNRAYLYETQTYSKLFSDIEIVIEKNPEKIFTLVTRIPARRLLEQLDLSELDTYWMTEQDGHNAIKPNFSSIHSIMGQSTNHTSERLVVIEGLELITDTIGPDQLLAEVAMFVDKLPSYNASCILCVDLLSLPVEIVAKLKFILDALDFSDEKIDVNIFEDETFTEPSILPGENMEYELGEDGNPRLVYLSKLPRIGFSNNILVKRILQWRRMGLDVSEIEPALKYQENDAYELYKSVEEKVRRAVDLDRFINSNSKSINASDLATDIFRLRQLTGLDELEKKYYESAN